MGLHLDGPFHPQIKSHFMENINLNNIKEEAVEAVEVKMETKETQEDAIPSAEAPEEMSKDMKPSTSTNEVEVKLNSQGLENDIPQSTKQLPPTEVDPPVKSKKIQKPKLKTGKRRRSDETESCKPSGSQPQTKKVKHSGNSKRLTMGVLHQNHPNSRLTQAQIKEALDLLLMKAIQEKTKVEPKFRGTQPMSGYVIINCSNRETADWVASQNGKITLKNGTPTKIVCGKNIPKPFIATGYFQECKDCSNEFILKLIGVQNRQLNVRCWRVLRRSMKKFSTELTFDIDAESAELLSNRPTINFKFGTTQLTVTETCHNDRQFRK